MGVDIVGLDVMNVSLEWPPAKNENFKRQKEDDRESENENENWFLGNIENSLWFILDCPLKIT